MFNYLTVDATMRDTMETAIETVLQFTPEEIKRIHDKKAAKDTWFWLLSLNAIFGAVVQEYLRSLLRCIGNM